MNMKTKAEPKSKSGPSVSSTVLLCGMMSESVLFAGEREAIESTLKAGEAFGYGNMMAWLATAWALHLRDEEGLPEKTAIEAVSNRGPYRLPHNERS